MVKLPIKDCCRDNWTWNRNDKSHEVRLIGSRAKVVKFHPNWSNGTAGIRGNRSLNNGRHYWEIKISQRVFGTSMMFGVGTKRARLHIDAFINLLGEDDQSWGLSHKGTLWHNGEWTQYTKPFRENEPVVIGMLFDWYKGTLTYFKDGVNLGVAFSGINHVTDDLYPIVCSTAAKTEMTLGVRLRTFQSLQDRCRAVILTATRPTTVNIDVLPLPKLIKNFIKAGVTS
ncbi:SPRY domain-containing SOCS box protein 3-like [Tubulanus polymorphus]|uniref:SPRY domain-containing SOCS box protein 3-like n=1 Tax=Tubulanus polymorphus TaxID=672921 RepID=UPI003DA2D102